YKNNKVLYLILYFFVKYTSTKYNYKIYNKKLFTIIYCFKKQYFKLEKKFITNISYY
ncbi:hypothetical protein BO86DRAFT_320241, partial [Aspergillus japonicus CBS 114.51]